MPLIKANIEGVGLDQAQKPVIVLSDAGNQKNVVPLWVGNAEAAAIHHYLNPLEDQESFTHDLVTTIFLQTGLSLVRVVIEKASNEVASAKLSIQNSQATFEIPSRPSDALALAIRMKAPIYAEDSLFQQAQVSTTSPAPPPIASPVPDANEPAREKLRRFFGGKGASS